MSKEFLIVFVDDKVGAVHRGRCTTITYTNRGNFVDFVQGLVEDFPGMKLRCVIDKDVENVLRNRIKADKMLEDSVLSAEICQKKSIQSKSITS